MPPSEQLPQQVDLREFGGPIKDQGEDELHRPCLFFRTRMDRAQVRKIVARLQPECLYAEELLASGELPQR